MSEKYKLFLPVLLIALIALALVSVNAIARWSLNSMSFAYKIPPIDAAVPKNYETATFAEGCFWGVESRFGSIEGVIRTRVGYAGGTSANPTYHDIGDYSESVQVDYDPARISYDGLLEVFWNSHDPTLLPGIRQYDSLILYSSEEQKAFALAGKQRQERKLGATIHTEIIPLTKFYPAEDYHQKWDLQRYPEIAAEFHSIYPRMKDFINSTAAAKINGYLGGNGTLAGLKAQISSLGLSPGASAELEKIAADILAKGGDGTCPVPGSR